MPNVARYGGVVLFLALFLGGCAGTSEMISVEENSSGETTYKTQKMRLDDFHLSSGLQKRNRFYIQISGTCAGDDCAPSGYTLSFIKEGPQPVTMEGRGVTLTVGSETLSWEDPQTRGGSVRTSTVRSGVFTSVEVSSKQLSTMGAARTLTGTCGGEQFTLTHQERAPIRALLSRLEQKSSESAGEETSEERD